MKEFWLEKNECTACGACENICPKDAITFVEDECGFKYPKINSNCIDCGLCEKVCKERLDEKFYKSSEPQVYAAWSMDEDTRYTSTSGGLFSELAREVINSEGYVCGALYNNKNMVEHSIINSKVGLQKIRQSKYIQSDINKIYRDIKTKLNNEKLVLFCGAPCQVGGLYSYLGKNYKNLITVDFICRGMNSPKAFRSWLSEIENEEKSKVKRVWFKYKENGWKRSPLCTRLDFENGNYSVYKGEKNLFMQGYLGANIYIRPSCGSCDFKDIPRQSDITLADFWGVKDEYDDDKGTSLVLVNSDKGKEVFNLIKERIFFKEMKLEDILKGNVAFSDSVKINTDSEKFLSELDNDKFSSVLARYYVPPKDGFLRKVKKVLSKTKLYKFLRDKIKK